MVPESKSTLLLAIDDDIQSLEFLKDALSSSTVEVLVASSSNAGLELFKQSRPQIVLLDLLMPGVHELELLEKILEIDPGTDVILISADHSTESAVRSIQAGAADYLAKPLNILALRSRIAQLVADGERRRKTGELEHELLDACQFEGIIGRSPIMQDVFAKIRKVSPHFRNVLITGATGTGKELVAR